MLGERSWCGESGKCIVCGASRGPLKDAEIAELVAGLRATAGFGDDEDGEDDEDEEDRDEYEDDED